MADSVQNLTKSSGTSLLASVRLFSYCDAALLALRCWWQSRHPSAMRVAQSRPSPHQMKTGPGSGARRCSSQRAQTSSKMPRRVALEGEKNELSGPGKPELAPEPIQAKLDQDRHLWNSHVDQLRDELLKMLEIVKARDSDKLFEAGSNIDRACETCHLEYWYPGDKAAVLRDRTSHVYGVQGGTK